MEKIVDLTYLNSMADGSTEVIIEMIGLFKQQIPEFTGEMETHLKNEDWLALSKIAHKAKSSITIMGMNDLADELKRLELLAKEAKNIEDYPAVIEKFKTDCQRAVRELDEEVENLKA